VRRWRHLRIRRGAFYGPPPNAVIPPPVPRIIRPAGALRTPARLLPSGRRTWGPAIPQGNQGQAWPQFLRQSRTADRRGLRLPVQRGHRFDPPWFPPPPIPPPQFLRPAGSLRTPARLLPSRRRRFDPGWGQANQGQAWPQFLRQPLTPDRRGMRLLPSRRRRFDPAWPQGNQGQAWPSFTRPASTRHRLPPARRGAIRPVVPPPAAPVIAQQGTVAVSAVLAATVTISDALAGTVAISDVLAGTVTIVSDL